MQAAFDHESEDLHWLALVITGDTSLAKESVVNASGLAPMSGRVFREWLVRWAHSATARVAAEAVRAEIFAAAEKYSQWSCSHTEHELISPEEAALLRRCDPLRIASDLDPLQRSVLVLRGMQRASVSYCALLLNVPRRSVVGAHCSVLEWLSHRQEEATSARRPNEGGAGAHSQPKVHIHERYDSYASKAIPQNVRTANGSFSS